MNKKLTIVFYDGMDNDGRGARAIHEMAHDIDNINNVVYIRLDRGLNILDRNVFERATSDLSVEKMHFITYLQRAGYKVCEIEHIFMLDIAPRYNRLLERSVEAKDLSKFMIDYGVNKITIIDHHPLEYNPVKFGFNYIYEHGVSACMITWKHFFPNKKAPKVVELINDRDVWINKMQPQTNYFHNVSKMMNQEELMSVIKRDKKALKAWLAIGEIREISNQKEIEKEIENMKLGLLCGIKVAYKKGDINYDILSGLGNTACKVYQYSVDAFVHVVQNKNGVWSYSMRSLNGQAKKIIMDNRLNGGGHDNSCGFKSSQYLIEQKN